MASGMLPKDINKEKIALDLMNIIVQQETFRLALNAKEQRKYYLELYAQCLRIVDGEDFEDVFDDME